MSDASSASMPDKRPNKPAGLAAGLRQDLPVLGFEEWDFRWIATQEEWNLVEAYELGREVMRLANLILAYDQTDRTKPRPAWIEFVTCGGLADLMKHLDRPGVPSYSLAKVLEVVMSSKPSLHERAALPPPAFALKRWAIEEAKKPTPQPALAIQEQVPVEWSPDSEEDSPPNDSFAYLGWGDFKPTSPSHKFILHVPMFQQLSRQEAVGQFQAWVSGSDLFSGVGRSKTPALLRLAFFRFNQGRKDLNVCNSYSLMLEGKVDIKALPEAERAGFSLQQYKDGFMAEYTGRSAFWSKSISSIRDELSVHAQTLANLATSSRRTTSGPGASLKVKADKLPVSKRRRH
jgi:hypothetical protein